jgi:hypothetical protein
LVLMVNAATIADDPRVNAKDIAITACVEATAPMASTTTTATAKAKVKKEMTAEEMEVQNQTQQVRWVAE